MHSDFHPWTNAPEQRAESTGATQAKLEAHQYQVGVGDWHSTRGAEPDSLELTNPYLNQVSDKHRTKQIDARSQTGDTHSQTGDTRSQPGDAGPQTTGDKRIVRPDQPVIKPGEQIPTREAKEFDLHKRPGVGPNVPEAKVYIPPGFDPSKPVNVIVYNHGQGERIDQSLDRHKLEEQMKNAPPNSILIIPKWQHKDGASNGVDGARANIRDSRMANFADALGHVAKQTGTTVDNIKSIQLLGHSAGNNGIDAELGALKKHPALYAKVNSVAFLDAHYSVNPEVRSWIKENVNNGNFKDGKASYTDYCPTTSQQALLLKGQLEEQYRRLHTPDPVHRASIRPNSKQSFLPDSIVIDAKTGDSHLGTPRARFGDALRRAPK